MFYDLSRRVLRLSGTVGQAIARQSATRSVLCCCTILLAVAAMPAPSLAQNTELYGTFMGDAVTFIDLTEESDKALPLYGAPINAGNLPGGFPPCLPADMCTISGNALAFSPLFFEAQSVNQVPPQDRTDGHLIFMAESKPGQSIQNIDFSERGAFSVGGFMGSNTSDTYVEVTGTGTVTVLEIDDNSSIIPLMIPIDLDIVFDTAPGGQFLAINRWSFSPQGAKSGAWDGSQFIDITQALLDDGRTVQPGGGATKISVNFDNILIAQSEPMGTALLDKKLFLIVTVNIPEPASCFLAMLGLTVVAMSARRTQR